MNQELVEILISIFQVNESTKIPLCTGVPKHMCAGACNVCPNGHIHISFNGRPHYLKHLIVLMDRVNV